MENIIFIAPPATGKSTQSKMLVEKYHYNYISTGKLLRKEVSDNKPLAKDIKKMIDTGNLVSDEIVTKLLEVKLKKINGPFVLDGYPRNISQAKNLELILKKLNLNIGHIIYIDIKYDEAIKRVKGRLICPQCNKVYNIHNNVMKPKHDNICDECLIKLIVRPDDNEEAYKKRYNIFVNETKPLLEYYHKQGLLSIVEDSFYPDEAFSKIEKIIL
ncbi:MAG: nucleoside monophosphate kinase [Bacilli bacterium]|nr:nucleoside monophosphate kinase [Bacilli bacterium]